MPSKDDVAENLPEDLLGLVPTAQEILRALGGNVHRYAIDTTFIRAVDKVKYVASASPTTAHRFGPPLALMNADGTLPHTWLYLAFDAIVASWESRMIKNNRGAGKGFHVTLKAEQAGLLATIRFARELRMWNLSDDHFSRLGVADIISNRDHYACHWLGLRVRQAMMMLPAVDRPDGFIYPSRIVKGQQALVIADWAVDDLFRNAKIDTKPFRGSDTYRRYMNDPMRTAAPEASDRPENPREYDADQL
jgi:hypothetical protein